jgi:bifunctional non-homologous end joining protein LigD
VRSAYAFDLINLQCEDWRNRPLAERKAKLEEILAGSDVRFSTSLTGDPNDIVEQVQKLGLEGCQRSVKVYQDGRFKVYHP